MNIIYVAPIFHTNQAPIVKGLLEEGHQVSFICQYEGKIEDHSYYTPYVMGYSGLFRFFQSFHTLLHRRKKRLHSASYPEAFRDRYGFPPVIRCFRYFREEEPDLIILRERSVYSIVTYLICKICRRKCILYNQTPLWDDAPPRNDLAYKIVKALTPSVRMTPVLGDPATGYLDETAVYIPFVIEPHLAPGEKTFFKDGRIHILCVGKFEYRKNHLMLLEVLEKLVPDYPLHLTLVGEMSTPYHEQYYQRVQKYISTHHLEDYVTCHTNCEPDKMSEFYGAADLFVLPSTGEFASISQLEAMSYSLPVIVSDTNGTSCYVENGKNGYLFKNQNQDDLKEKILAIITDRAAIPQMGACSYRLVTEKYSLHDYREKIRLLRS